MPTPRCSYCETAFVEVKYEVCEDCQDSNLCCSNCSKPVQSGSKVAYGEYWCWPCIQQYEKRDEKKLLRQQVLRNRELISAYKIANNAAEINCRGCDRLFQPLYVVEKFCGRCQLRMKNHECLTCGQKYDKNVGCDEFGLCIKCSSTDSADRMHDGTVRFKNVEGLCPNCEQEWLEGSDVICKVCTKKLNEVLNGRF